MPPLVVRCGGVLALLLVALAFDLAQRAAPTEPAQAVMPAGADGMDPSRLRRVAQGEIPMPPHALAAHASSLLSMPPGQSATVTAFWFAGDRESAPNVQIAASQFDRKTQSWLPARYVVDRHVMGYQLGFGLRRLGNPMPWMDASGRMHLFVVATGWGGWAAARILHLVQSSASNDLATLAFEPVRVLPLSWFWNISYLVRNNPLPLADGGMLLPVHFELGITYPVALRFDRMGTFTGMQRISRRNYLLQPTVLMQSPTQWLALMRDQRPDGHVAAAQTRDGGQHWQDLPDLVLVNPDAAINGLGLAGHGMLLVHNSSPHSRALLDLSTSPDGVQWARVQALAAGGTGDEYSYPELAWADGALWVTYTDHRKSIAWQRFEPEAPGGGLPR